MPAWRAAGVYTSPLSSPPFFPYHGAFFSSWGRRGIFIGTCLARRCDNILLCHTLCIPYRERVQGVGGVWAWRAAGVHTSPFSLPPHFFPYHGAFFFSWGGRGIFICTCLACRCRNILLCHTLCIPYRERVHGVGGVWVSRGASGVHTSPPSLFFSYLGVYTASHTFFVMLFAIPCFSLTLSLSSCTLQALGVYGPMDIWAWHVNVCMIHDACGCFVVCFCVPKSLRRPPSQHT